jgi:hypothetical protein
LVFVSGALLVDADVDENLYNYENKIVPCYDRVGNEIIGLNCVAEVETFDIRISVLLTSFIGGLFLFVHFMFKLVEDKDD